MSIVSILCLLILLVVILTCFRKSADVFSPIRVFSTVWAISIGLADLKLSAFQHQWSAWAWAVLLLGIISYLAGAFTIYVLNIKTKITSIATFRGMLGQISIISQKKYVIIILCVFGLYSIAYSIETIAYGGVPMFSSSPDKARTEYGVFAIHLFVSMASSILIFCNEYFAGFNPPS